MSYNENLGYVIIKDSDRSWGSVVFLADRNVQTKKWWTAKLSEAFPFISEIAAQKRCEKLKYNNPRVRARVDFHKE